MSPSRRSWSESSGGPWLAAAAVCIGLILTPGSSVASDKAECASLRIANPPVDYRLRESTSALKWSYADNWRAHTERAVRAVSMGRYSREEMIQINWTLTRWPNHMPALAALVRYSVGGGRAYEFYPPYCYFDSVRRIFPDDVDVVMLEGYWYYKKGDLTKAEQTYLDVLQMTSGSTEAEYNLGLVYAEQKQYDKAREHAWAAYAGGYPLPGLRKKLEAAGQWRNPPPPSQPTDENPK